MTHEEQQNLIRAFYEATNDHPDQPDPLKACDLCRARASARKLLDLPAVEVED